TVVMMSVILDMPERYTPSAMGLVVITYTVLGGIKAVTWSDVQQMCIIFLGLVIALVTVFLLLPQSVQSAPALSPVIVLLPRSVSLGDAVYRRGPVCKPNAATIKFDGAGRFNIWGGLLG